MPKVVFPGTFDPFTNGHVDVVSRSLGIFGRVVIAVLNNPEKDTLFTLEERLSLIRRIFESEGDRVVVDSFNGLLVDYVQRHEAKIIVRGLRAISDYDYEAQMALMNRSLNPEIETLFLITREQNSYISSTLVRQVARFGGDVSQLVPAVVDTEVKKKYRQGLQTDTSKP